MSSGEWGQQALYPQVRGLVMRGVEGGSEWVEQVSEIRGGEVVEGFVCFLYSILFYIF